MGGSKWTGGWEISENFNKWGWEISEKFNKWGWEISEKFKKRYG